MKPNYDGKFYQMTASRTKTELCAAIIAGGEGTRIRSISGGAIPKAMVPVAGTPIVFRQLRLLHRYGIRDVAVVAGRLAGVLKDGMKPEAARLGMRLSFFVEKKPLGTAGGLTAAREVLGDGAFLVLYGDMAVEMDLLRFRDFHAAKGGVATIAAHPNDHPQTSDLLVTDDADRVSEILLRKERAPGEYRNLVSAAVYCFSPGIFDAIQPDTAQDFVRDVFPRLIRAGKPIFAYNTPEYLRDMGTVERYALVEKDINSGYIDALNFANKHPAVFFDRDGVLNEALPEPGVVRADQLRLLAGAAEAVRLVNESGRLAVLVTNQPQVAKGFTSWDELNRIHARLETLLGREGAKLDRIYYCPHHPERGFDGEIPELKVDCPCRKPHPGMLLRANEELPIQLDASCVVGDTARDILAARNAGIAAYGVQTGNGCRDCISAARAPDRLFADVLDAVRHIVQNQWRLS